MKLLSFAFISILISGFIISCRNNNLSREEENIQIAKEYFEAFNKHNWLRFADYYSEDALLLDPSYGSQYIKFDRVEFISKYQKMSAVSPDINDSIVCITAQEDKVAVEFISSGSVENSRIKWQKPICSILTFKDGKIIRDATYFDKD